MPKKLSKPRIELLRALNDGAELRTDIGLGFTSWEKSTVHTPSPPKQQAVKAAHDDGHLKFLRHKATGRSFTVGDAEHPINDSVWGISDAGRAALASI